MKHAIWLIVSLITLVACGGGSSSSSDEPTEANAPAPTLSASSGHEAIRLSWPSGETSDIFYSTDPDCDWDNYSLCSNSGMKVGVEGGSLHLGSDDRLLLDKTYTLVRRTDGEMSDRVSASARRYMLNGRVRDTVVHGDRVYVVGDFSRYSPTVLNLALFDTTSEQAQLTGGALNTDGEVEAIVPDPRGGWIVGGSFTQVQGMARHGIARIRADGRVDPDWLTALGSEGSTPSAEHLLIDGDRLFVSGDFTSINHGTVSMQQSYLASVALESGEIRAEFAPEVAEAPRALTVADGYLIAGGHELLKGESDAGKLLKIDPSEGTLESDLTPDVMTYGQIQSVAVHGGKLFAGTGFQTPYNSRLLVISLDSGERVSWGPEVHNSVEALHIDEDRLYVGGRFGMVGNEDRPSIAALSLNDGQLVKEWAPEVESDHMRSVGDITSSEEHIYFGGRFNKVDQKPRTSFVRVARDTGEVDAGWNADITDEPGGVREVLAIGVQNGKVLTGGSFVSAGGVPRHNLAALELASGRLVEGWDVPVESGSLHAIAVRGGDIYVGGSTGITVDGVARDGGAMIAVDTGGVGSWNPRTNNDVRDIVVHSDRVFIAGRFTKVDSGNRRRLAEVDPISGDVLGNTDPEIGDSDISVSGADQVSSIHIDSVTPPGEERLIVGGRFDQVGTTDRTNLAMLDRDTFALKSWDPGLEGTTPSVITVGSHADSGYLLGGFFHKAFGEDSPAFAHVTDDALWGGATSVTDGEVRSVVSTMGHYIVGGGFTQFNDEARAYLAELVPEESATLTERSFPELDDQVRTVQLAGSNDYIVVGGDFTRIGDSNRRAVAVFDSDTLELVW